MVASLASEPGENARIEVHRDLSGGVKLVVKDSANPKGYPVMVSPKVAVGLALAILEAAGVPINAQLAARAALKNGG